MGLRAARRQEQSFGNKLLGGLMTGAKALGTAKMVWDVGRTAYQLGSAVAPYAAMLL